jgi:uncharacterized protein YyaL (SSP411 family)
VSTFQQGFEKRTQATLQWVERSIQATGYRGSAAYFHIWRGWSAAYPETTGYLIETLLDYAAYFNNESYKNLAVSCADWLCSIQRADGAFPGGLGTNGNPIIFDTGQILFGLKHTFDATQEVKYQIALKKAVSWLIENLEPDGSWQRHAYVPGYLSTYSTQVIWAILQANEVLQSAAIQQKMKHALDFYVQRITPQCSVQNWAFRPGEAAYTHTIAYTIRGFLESGNLLKDQHLIQTSAAMMNALLKEYHKRGKLAGRYDEHWYGDYAFTCVTGNAQLSLVLARLYELTRKKKYYKTAIEIFQSTFAMQWRAPLAGLFGGIPGSQPIWGPYQRFAFPNWAAKFYLDAYLLLKKLYDTNSALTK